MSLNKARQFSDLELAQCARRELAQRGRVYPRLVAEGRMHQETAQYEIRLMREIMEFFERQAQPDLF